MSTDIQTKFTELAGIIATAQKSAERLETGVKAEAVRCRAGLQIASKLISQLRKDVLAHRQSLPTKTRGAKAKVVPVTTEPEAPPPSDVETDIEEVPPALKLKRESTTKPKPKTRRSKKQ